MLNSILVCADAYGPVTAIFAPEGRLSELLSELADHPDLIDIAAEGDESRLQVEAGGVWWFFGGLS